MAGKTRNEDKTWIQFGNYVVEFHRPETGPFWIVRMVGEEWTISAHKSFAAARGAVRRYEARDKRYQARHP